MTAVGIAEGFRALFTGRTDAIGLEAGGVDRRVVIQGDYGAHILGRRGLGIFPLLDDGTVHFASIDLDRPDFRLAHELARRLPGKAFVERSKSGNAHVHCFFAEPCPAWAARGVLRDALDDVNEPHVEVFPKQSQLAHAGMVGNYIRLPYFGDTRPVLDVFGQEVPLADFVAHALETRQRPAVWEMYARALGAAPAEERQASGREFGSDAYLHICAEHIIKGALSGERPITEGHRSAVYFALSKMLLMWSEMDQDGAWSTLREVADASPHPIAARELSRVFNNAASGRWTSFSCDDPIVQPFSSPECPYAR